MDIHVATKTFERWLSGQVRIVAGDLRHKHIAMGANPFCFLRATYYRWAQLAADFGGRVAKAPRVLAVGDLHLENFGTWRDALGRLAWGINDFDEAFPLPYTHDLVRLATSAVLAIDLDHLGLGYKAACRAIAEGYREGMQTGGRPFVIGDEHRWFKPILQNPLRDPGLFWDKLRALPLDRSTVPAQAKAAIVDVLPDRRIKFEVRHRIAGLGNLGKPRYTALAEFHGGPVAREAKALTISAASWAQSRSEGPFYAKILANAIRSPDPFLKVHTSWIVRRLAPDCRRLELTSLSRVKDEEWLLHAMGFETANVHLGTSAARRAIQRHMTDLPKNALRKAAMIARDALLTDFQAWRKDH
jgi:hypothetical protein